MAARVTTRNIGLLVALGMALLAAGCTAPGDKTGDTTTVLRMATLDTRVDSNGQTPGPGTFIRALDRVSGGRMTVHLETGFGTGEASDESALVRAIGRGRVDGGWPATRAFAGAGIPGVQAVEAPMVLTSYAAERALVTGAAAHAVLSRLDRGGVLTLGLLVGPLRRPFAADQPLLGPADWAGVRFRSFHSAVQDETIAALGGTPVEVGAEVTAAVRDGRLRGAELDVAQYLINGGGTEAGNVTANVVLWPKVLVLTFNADRLRSLTAEQRGWVGTAAAMATRASGRAAYDETTAAARLCQRGVRFATAATDQLRDLHSRVAPVVSALASDRIEAPVLAAVQRVAAAYPGTDAVPAPLTCFHGVAAQEQAVRIPRAASALPDGVYRTQITAAMLASAGVDPADGYSGGTWTLTIRHATYELRCHPLGGSKVAECGTAVTDKPLDLGDLRGHGHSVVFVPNEARLASVSGCTIGSGTGDACGVGGPYRATWSIADGQLSFSDYVGEGGNQQLLVAPWTRIG
jgi:TRAP-type C4-dicarboxylate transport system substrate-binding protein